MSGKHLTAGLCCCLALLAVALGLTIDRASAQGGPSPRAEASSVEPIVLIADQVTYWDEGTRRWVWLEGKAAVGQGTDGLSASRAIARIDTISAGTLTSYEVEVYAEGEVSLTERPDESFANLRVRHASRTDVRIRSGRPGGIAPAESVPAEANDLLGRAFPATPVQIPAAAGIGVGDQSVQQAQFGTDEPGIVPPGLDDELFGLPDPSAGAGAGLQEGPFDDDLSMPDLGDFPEIDSDSLIPPTELTPDEVADLPPIGDLGEAPLLPESRRVISISPRDSGPNFTIKSEPVPGQPGQFKILIRGGVRIIAEEPGKGIIDVSADSAVIWTKLAGGLSGGPAGSSVPSIDPDPRQPFEVYLEGHVVFRQDLRQVAGDGDQKEVLSEQFYMDLRKEWWFAQQAELNLFDSRFMTPIKTKGSTIQQYRPFEGSQDDSVQFGPTQIRADQTMVTGSRFPVPGYRFTSNSVDLTQTYVPLINPYTGKPVLEPGTPGAPQDTSWTIDARQNIFYLGPIPAFYWPRFVADPDDLDPPLRQIQYRYVNFFGNQFLTDWSMFKILGLRKPYFVDDWNLDVDYLSARGPALGSAVGWSGRDLIGDLTDPYKLRATGPPRDRSYTGYFNAWGIRDSRSDTVGSGRAVMTVGPPWSVRPFFRDNAPSFETYRGRAVFRHMQSFVPLDGPFDEDFRFQLEAAYISDRRFLEQFYKRLFDSGMDQLTLGYMIRQRENTALTLHAEANLLDWHTQSQFFPKLDYFRLGDSLFNGLFSYSQNSGIHYANTHTALEVANPNIFAILPFDPVTATSGPFRSGRAWTSHELSMPLNFGFLRFMPYVQGQLAGWDNQFENELPSLDLINVLPPEAFIRGPQGSTLGRVWGAAGAHANIMAWRTFPDVESELLNLHGLAHKVNFDANYRNAYSNVPIGRLGIQDNIDHNTYEFVRRFFALEQFETQLPAQYDPRLLTLRRTISPITGSTDIQDSMHTVDFSIRQRLQTRRGPEGRRRIVDIMTLDLNSTYFPQADRDNFGKEFGQNTYNWEWFIGDRTSFQSYGWFEFFDIVGEPVPLASPRGTNDPFGIRVITSGISLNRPPRGNVFIGYSVINTGPIATSALNVAFSYWMSPKWYSSFGISYDFGNAILLGSTVGITRIGADWLTSLGLSFDPQRDAVMFGFELTPRLSPSIRFGSGGGVARFDSRFAPVE